MACSYSSERLGTYECCMHELTFFTLTSACLANEGAKLRRNRTLQERCTTNSSCSTYRVGKVQSIFSLPVNKKLLHYSVIPLFRYSVFRVLPTPLTNESMGSWSEVDTSADIKSKHLLATNSLAGDPHDKIDILTVGDRDADPVGIPSNIDTIHPNSIS